ncbi:hypothetical protein VI03_14310 [Burkholderia vietnamiensis]|nr:hypothetical protein VI03_14310 [Burkholderia vietnamiensis]
MNYLFCICRRRHREFNHVFESSPYSRVQQFRMVRRTNKQPLRWPVIDRLQQHCYETFQLAYIRTVIPAFCDRIEFIEQEQRIPLLGIVEHRTYVVSCSPEKAAHHRGEIKGN